jgi:hypothetical protein
MEEEEKCPFDPKIERGVQASIGMPRILLK